ncbi:MAG: hypothetical protein AAB535_03510 [Patescibacteria group bacterium]
MQIQVSCIRNGRHNLTAKQLSKKGVRERQDVQQEIQRLLIKHGLTIEAVILKYKELVYPSKSYEPKASDVLRILERLQQLHLSELSK